MSKLEKAIEKAKNEAAHEYVDGEYFSIGLHDKLTKDGPTVEVEVQPDKTLFNFSGTARPAKAEVKKFVKQLDNLAIEFLGKMAKKA